MKFIFIFFLSLSSIALAKETCPSGQYWVKAHFRKSYTRSDGTLVKASNVTAHCRTLSREAAYLQPRFKDTAPKIWPNKTEKSKAWQEHEKELVEDALQEVPDLLLSNSLIAIHRMEKSEEYPNPASSVPGVLSLYNSSFGHPKGLSRIIAHELAHQLFEDLSPKQKDRYRESAGWRIKLDNIDNRTLLWTRRKSGYVEPDGVISSSEDFANNVEYFLYAPEKLKNITPGAYDWIKTNFGDKLKLKKVK